MDNVYKKLTKARNLLLQAEMKKSATNGFAKFKYMELTDIIPITEKISEEVGISVITSFYEKRVVTTVYNHDDKNDFIEFKSPFSIDLATGQIKGAQAIGALHTYFRRYMLMLVFEIMEHDALDAAVGSPVTENGKKAVETKKNTAEDQKSLDLVKANFKMISQQFQKAKNVTPKEVFKKYSISANSTEAEIVEACKLMQSEMI